MKTLCVVPCGHIKIWNKFPNAGPTPAGEVYIGNFAMKMQEYAKTFHPDSYVILSAKHGYLFPLDLVPENYNVTFKKKETNPISLEALKKIAEVKHLFAYDRIIVVAGKEYAGITKEVFKGKLVLTPLNDCKNMFDIIELVNRAITRNKPFDE